MKTGNFTISDYLNKLHEEVETTKGYNASSEKDGLILPEDTKRNFDWLNKEYQKGKTEVKVEVKGEGSSFKPGYDLQTDLKSVKDFKPGMYGEINTEDSKTSNKTDDKNTEKNVEENSVSKEEGKSSDTEKTDSSKSIKKKKSVKFKKKKSNKPKEEEQNDDQG